MKKVMSKGGVDSWVLPHNQLQVLSHGMPFKDVVGVMITYLVGSRLERRGQTGATHFLEHMMFKGSEKYQKKKGNDIDHLESIGAQINASTWFDRTNYYALIPKDYLQQVIDMEADRMRFALLSSEDVASERTVILNEHDQGENSHHGYLLKLLWAKAFDEHGYRHPTIGWREDIEQMSVADLREYYDQLYHPNRATLTLVGDLNDVPWQAWVESSFGGITSQASEVDVIVEPAQHSMKRFEITRSAPEDLVATAFKIPRALDSDFLALDVLSSILGDGPISLLAKACVDKRLVRWIYADASVSYEPGLLSIVAAVAPGQTADDVEKAIMDVITDIQENGIDDAVLQRILMQRRSEMIFQQDSIMEQLQSLNESIALGSWYRPIDWLQEMTLLTPEMIQQVCQKYCQQQQMTIGRLLREES